MSKLSSIYGFCQRCWSCCQRNRYNNSASISRNPIVFMTCGNFMILQNGCGLNWLQPFLILLGDFLTAPFLFPERSCSVVFFYFARWKDTPKFLFSFGATADSLWGKVFVINISGILLSASVLRENLDQSTVAAVMLVFY